MKSSKPLLITIAGPQSSGKTVAFNFIKKAFPQFNYLEETNPYTIAGKNHLGAVFTKEETEIKITTHGIKQIRKIKKTTVVETGIFHLVYGKVFCSKKISDRFYQKYLQTYKQTTPWIVFIDTKPEISWRRRYSKYTERVKKLPKRKQEEFLGKYQRNIYRLYPIWLKYLEVFPFKKIIIRNSYKKLPLFKKELFIRFSEILKNY